MNDSRHEKAWNDPPLFSVDQMSRATNPTVISRRNRYPQQPITNPPMNPMNNPMISANQQTFGSNVATNEQSFGHPMQQQNQFMNQTSYGQPMPQTNAMNSYEPAFDANAFVYSIQTLIGSTNHLPQELVLQWHNIQNHIYGVPIESQTKAYFQSILTSIQTKDFNNCRLYCNYLSNDSNQTIRTVAAILSQIFRYFP